MSVEVKICGLNEARAVMAAVEAGARYAGFVFYPRSPRAVNAMKAESLIKQLSSLVTPVGLFVDAADNEIMQVLSTVPLRMLQLHGSESPERVAAIKKLTGLPVIKAIGVATATDVASAHTYEPIADMLLFDAKPDVLPGGNARAFDWSLLAKQSFSKPWMLAGGITVDNLAEAVTASKAHIVDVSSGVEDAPGRKNPNKIRNFLQRAREIETCC